MTYLVRETRELLQKKVTYTESKITGGKKDIAQRINTDIQQLLYSVKHGVVSEVAVPTMECREPWKKSYALQAQERSFGRICLMYKVHH